MAANTRYVASIFGSKRAKLDDVQESLDQEISDRKAADNAIVVDIEAVDNELKELKRNPAEDLELQSPGVEVTWQSNSTNTVPSNGNLIKFDDTNLAYAYGDRLDIHNFDYVLEFNILPTNDNQAAGWVGLTTRDLAHFVPQVGSSFTGDLTSFWNVPSFGQGVLIRFHPSLRLIQVSEVPNVNSSNGLWTITQQATNNNIANQCILTITIEGGNITDLQAGFPNANPFPFASLIIPDMQTNGYPLSYIPLSDEPHFIAVFDPPGAAQSDSSWDITGYIRSKTVRADKAISGLIAPRPINRDSGSYINHINSNTSYHELKEIPPFLLNGIGSEITKDFCFLQKPLYRGQRMTLNNKGTVTLTVIQPDGIATLTTLPVGTPKDIIADTETSWSVIN